MVWISGEEQASIGNQILGIGMFLGICLVLYQSINLPWLCFGDFNELVSIDEKFGGGN